MKPKNTPKPIARITGKQDAEVLEHQIQCWTAFLKSTNNPSKMGGLERMRAIAQDAGLIFAVTEEQILSRQRWQPLSTARQLTMLISLESLPFATMGQLARFFKKDRTALIHGRNTILDVITYDKNLRKVVDVFREKYVKSIDELLR